MPEREHINNVYPNLPRRSEPIIVNPKIKTETGIIDERILFSAAFIRDAIEFANNLEEAINSGSLERVRSNILREISTPLTERLRETLPEEDANYN